MMKELYEYDNIVENKLQRMLMWAAIRISS